jgi:RNA polymerase sigma-B factor
MESATTSPASVRGLLDPSRGGRLDERAAALVSELAALPAGHPARPGLRDETITAWLPMARRLARRYTDRGEALDDLIQVATVGLIKAVDRFDPAVGADFPGYAIPTIVGELKRHFRDRTWSIRVPRRLQELRMAITKAGNELMHVLGRSPTVADVAAHLGVSEEEVIEGLEGARAYRSTSLSTPVGPDGLLELGDRLGAEDGDFARTELHLSLKPAMACLTERERFIIATRFYGNQTQAQVAAQIGVSQMHVSRLLAGALAKLRAQLGGDG